MNRMIRAFALPILAAGLTCLPTSAQDHPDQDRHDQAQEHHDSYRHHGEWKKGYHMKDEDWNRGEKVDYRTYHLRRPPEGQEWRQIDGNFVLGSREGIVVSVQAAPHH